MGTVNASSANGSDVQTAINSATAGDTVVIPSGSGTWDSTNGNVALAKAITLQGAGQGSTNITLGTGNTITKQAGGVTRIEDISFSKSGGGNSSYGATLQGDWTARPMVFKNCDFTVSGSAMFDVYVAGGCIWGSCNFTSGADDSILKMKVDDRTGSTAGTSVSWQTDHSMGSADTSGELNHYVEDCYFYGGANQVIDVDDACRCVFRYNTCDWASFNSHGLATSGIGVRHWEVYENTFNFESIEGPDPTNALANMNWVVWIRGATGVIFNNYLEDIAGSFWGAKPECKLDVRAQQDDSGSTYGDFQDGRAWTSSGQGTYPRQHQIGVNWDSGEPSNSGYFIDPIYIWGNTGSGSNASGGILSVDISGNWASQTGYVTENTDFFNDGTQRPSYSAYTYPHPLLAATVVSARGLTTNRGTIWTRFSW